MIPAADRPADRPENQPANRPANRGARGFTLVEVVVGALVLGIFVSFIYGAVVSAFRVRNVVQSTTSAMARGTMAIEIVARDLESSFFRPIEGDEYFKCDEDGGRAVLDFITTTDSRRQEEFDKRLVRSDITEVGYRLRQGDGSMVLYRREQFGVDDKPLEGGDYFKVVDGVKEFEIEWFEKDPGAEDGDEDRDATKTWDSKEKKKLPRCGKILLVLEGKSSDPSKADETAEFRFTRWVVLPGADDKDPKAEAPAGGPPAGGNPPAGGGN